MVRADEPCGLLPDLWLPPHGTPLSALGDLSVQATTGGVCQGGTVTITVTVMNPSCGDAGPFDVTVWYGGTSNVIETKRVAGLPGCEYVVLTFTWDTTAVPPGEYEIGACVDTGHEVIELNETNNCLVIDRRLWIHPNEPLIEVEKVAVDTDGGAVRPGDTVRYEVVLRNEGCSDMPDGPDHEFTDVLPSGVSATTYATATSGVAAFEGETLVWDGGLRAGETVTIKYRVTVDADVEPGTPICNQGFAHWDSDGDGTKDAHEPSDDPTTPEEDDPTCFVVDERLVLPVPVSGTIDAPTLSEWGTIALACLFVLAFVWRITRAAAVLAERRP